jgi:hypothetical protein|uniref:Uncharacterized protein n=1 Tax=Desulfobacca acetoxidans TaxID=60893 RepID=A0A7C3WPA1_9BACT
MEAVKLEQEFSEKYFGPEKIWSGHSFTDYPDLRAPLEELPVSEVPEPTKSYTHRFSGILDNVYGELLYTLLEYEGYFKDKAYHIDRCTIRPVIRPANAILVFTIEYTSKEGEKGSQTFEILRTDKRNYLFFTDKYRTS